MPNTREKLVELVSNVLVKYDRGCLPFVMDELADILITNDVVPVVRCKDCKQYNGHRYCTYFAETVLDDDFCSYGERRNDG